MCGYCTEGLRLIYGDTSGHPRRRASAQVGCVKRKSRKNGSMKTFSAVAERCPDTALYVGYVPGFPGAYTQAETLDELHRNLREVIEMLL